MGTDSQVLGTPAAILGRLTQKTEDTRDHVNQLEQKMGQRVGNLETKVDRLYGLGTKLMFGLIISIVSSLILAIATLVAAGKVVL